MNLPEVVTPLYIYQKEDTNISLSTYGSSMSAVEFYKAGIGVEIKSREKLIVGERRYKVRVDSTMYDVVTGLNSYYGI